MTSANHHDDELRHAERIAYLIAGCLRGMLIEGELAELNEWILASDESLALFEKLIDVEHIGKAMQQYLQAEREKTKVLLMIKEKIQEKSGRPPYVSSGLACWLHLRIYYL